MDPSLPLLSGALSLRDADALRDLFRRGTPENTLRAYRQDLGYISAWKLARLGTDLLWPETEETALTFLLDHSRGLQDALPDDPAHRAATALIASGLRRSLHAPAAATLSRRVATWRALHRTRNLASPFESPLLRSALAKTRRTLARPQSPKSARPITRDLLEQLIATCTDGHRGRRDKALLMLGWASGGRRREELTRLRISDLDLSEMASQTRIWITLPGTKTTEADKTPRLILKGPAAKAVSAWITQAELETGPLFRAISKADRVLPRGLTPDGIYQILKNRLARAGLPEDTATPHGLRSGFLTQAALDGVPIQASMRLSLHRSAAQAQKYYDDVDIAENPATDLICTKGL